MGRNGTRAARPFASGKFARKHFANVRQNPLGFAKDWQTVSRARRVVLPMFGKIGPFLPTLGKNRKTRGLPRVLRFSLFTLRFSLAQVPQAPTRSAAGWRLR
jgi:hypothetical protein